VVKIDLLVCKLLDLMKRFKVFHFGYIRFVGSAHPTDWGLSPGIVDESGIVVVVALS
jgi:hypothetical protein